MKKLSLLIFVLILRSYCYAQTGYKIDLGVNRLNTGFILRNGMDNSISKGYGINFSISKPNSSRRISTQYSQYKPLDMSSAWKNVSAHKVEINVEIVTHFDNIELLLCPFLGISYNYISGTYTGKNDPDALARYYSINSKVTNRWPGLTAGIGIERNIKRIVLFANYRMHIVKAEDAIRIMDIGLDAGLKYHFDLKLKKRTKNNSEENNDQSPPQKKNKPTRSIFKRLKMPDKRYDIH